MWVRRKVLLAAVAGLLLSPAGAWAAAVNYVSPVQSYSCTNQVTTSLAQGTGAFTCSSLTAAMFATGTQGQVLNSPSSTTYSFTATPTLGVGGTTAGTLTFENAAAAFGVTIQEAGTAAASYNFNLPLTVGSAGQALVSEGGGSTPMQWATVLAAKMTVSSKTTGYQIATGTDDWTRFDNTGAGGSVILTVPTSANTSAGDNWCAEVNVAQTLEMLANSGQTFTIGNTVGAAAGNLQANTIGSSWCVYAQSSTNLIVYSSTGAIQVN